MSLSLIAVFVPILFMGGIVGRLFHEFAFVLATSIAVSMFVSLTVTPTMCAFLLKPAAAERQGGFFALLLDGYGRSLAWALRHPAIVILSLLLHGSGKVSRYADSSAFEATFIQARPDGVFVTNWFAEVSSLFPGLERHSRAGTRPPLWPSESLPENVA